MKREKELESELAELKNVDDVKEENESTSGLYDISSYGVDYTVEFLVKKINQESFIIPDFQREYVWSKNDASKFIESILLGLPVPGIFLFKEHETAKHLVIDGQQRLKSLANFYNGEYRDRAFKLSGLKSKWNGRSYQDLTSLEKERLDDGVIHTTVFKQDTPSGNMDSVYEVFERINTGGLKLSAQEIRSCVAHGKLNELLFSLNEFEYWRKIFGKKSIRLKDIELILRFIALLNHKSEYKKPMKKFLSDYMVGNRDPSQRQLEDVSKIFTSTFELIFKALGKKAFRPQGPLNAAVFDSVSCVVASKVMRGDDIHLNDIKSTYEKLIALPSYQETYMRATSDESILNKRFSIAEKEFG